MESPSSDIRPEPAEPLDLFLHINATVIVGWDAVEGADHYVVSRFAYGVKTLPASTTSYSWPDRIDFLSHEDTVVHPEVVEVKAMRGADVLETFSSGESCPTLMFLAARGSGQNVLGGSFESFAGGLGSRGERVWDGIVDGLETTPIDLPGIAVEYPAVAVALKGGVIQPGNDPSVYNDSVGEGVSRTLEVVHSSLKLCPDIDIVLFGYSQGAQVVGTAYAAMPESERSHVIRLVLFADPLFHPGDPGVRYLPTTLTHHGIKGERADFPPGDAVVESWCWSGDEICQLHVGFPHFHGPIYDEFEKQAVASAVGELDMVDRTPINQRHIPTLKERLDKILREDHRSRRRDR